MAKFGEEWNFPYEFPAVDGSHVPINPFMTEAVII